MSKNLLVVSISAPPQNSPESLQVAKYLSNLSRSWNITLVTIKNAGGWRRPDHSLNESLAKVKQVIRLPHFTSGIYSIFLRLFFGNLMVRPDQDFLFFRQWRRVVRKIKDKPSLIYSRATPFSSSLMALKLKKHYKIPWVMHLSDPWTISPHFVHSGSTRTYHENAEGECFENADIIALTSHELIDDYKKKYPEFSDKFVFSSNVYDDNELTSNPFQFDGKLKFVHTGNFYGEGRSPLFLLKAIKAIMTQRPGFLDNTEFIFMGRFNADVRKVFSDFPLPFIKVREEYSFWDSVSLQRNGHVMILIDWKFKNGKSVFFPSKILGYMAAQRPILAITEKFSTSYNVIEGRYGYCFDHFDTDEIADYIVRAVENYEKRNIAFFSTEKPDPAYSSRVNTENLSTLFNSLVS